MLVLVFDDDGPEGRLVDAMALDDSAVDVETRSASVLTVGAVPSLGP